MRRQNSKHQATVNVDERRLNELSTRHQTSKHITKYQADNSSLLKANDLKYEIVAANEDDDSEGGDLPEGDQIVIDIGHLKDIDHSPQNIKELSKMMADQISKLLSQEIQKQNLEQPGSGKAGPIRRTLA